MSTLTWLHLSDLHYCHPKSGWDADSILQDLKDDFRLMQETQRLQPDLIFFTGDVAFGHLGDKEGHSIQSQYKGAGAFLEQVATSFDAPVPLANVFLVPGNHDVNRFSIPSATWDWLDNMRDLDAGIDNITDAIDGCDQNWMICIKRLAEYKSFLANSGYAHLLGDQNRLIYALSRRVQDNVIGIAGLNSAWSSGRRDEQSRLWLAGDWQIKRLKADLRDAQVKIALMHHPSHWLTAAENSHIAQMLQGTFHFVLHGHVHDQWVTVNNLGDRYVNVQVAAGACYSRKHKEAGYNFVRLNFATGRGEIWLRRYEDKGRGGWVPLVIPNGGTDNDGKFIIGNVGNAPIPRGHRTGQKGNGDGGGPTAAMLEETQNAFRSASLARFGKRIVWAGVWPYKAFFKSERRASGVDFHLLLDREEPGDQEMLRQVGKDTIPDLTFQYWDEVQQMGWAHYRSLNHGSCFVANWASAETLIGKENPFEKVIERRQAGEDSIFVRRVDLYRRDLRNEMEAYFDRVRHRYIKEPKLDEIADFYDKYLMRVVTNMLLYCGRIGYRQIHDCDYAMIAGCASSETCLSDRTKENVVKVFMDREFAGKPFSERIRVYHELIRCLGRDRMRLYEEAHGVNVSP